MSSLKSIALASLGAIMSAGASFAADLAPPPPPPPLPPVVQEFSGWYIRGDIGGAFPVVNSFESIAVPAVNFSHDYHSVGNAWIFGIGAGYQFNSWFRADVTAEYRTQMKYRATDSYSIGCVGARCLDLYTGNLNQPVFLVNGYFDLGTWYNVTPYIGVGLGTAYNQFGQVRDFNPTAAGYGASVGTDKWGFAWALMAGASINLTETLKFDIGYRYLNLGEYTAAIKCECGNSTQIHKFNLASQDVRIGLRYLFTDTVLPPPPPLVRKY